MEPLEVFEVISPVPAEAAVYRDITADVMSDLRLASAIGRIHVAVYPVKALYIMAAILRDVEMPVKISDMAVTDTFFDNGENYVRITIEREKYMPELTRYLWDRYTPANVVQADRWTILIRTEAAAEAAAEAAVLPDKMIANPALNLHANMVEFSVRAVPEGFRVRYHTFENNEFLFVASEDVLEPRWLELGKKIMADLKASKASVTEADGGEKKGPIEAGGGKKEKLTGKAVLKKESKETWEDL